MMDGNLIFEDKKRVSSKCPFPTRHFFSWSKCYFQPQNHGCLLLETSFPLIGIHHFEMYFRRCTSWSIELQKTLKVNDHLKHMVVPFWMMINNSQLKKKNGETHKSISNKNGGQGLPGKTYYINGMVPP